MESCEIHHYILSQGRKDAEIFKEVLYGQSFFYAAKAYPERV